MLGSPFLRRFLQDHAAGRNSIIAPPESKPASVRNSVATRTLTHLLLNSSFQMSYAFLPTRGGPRIISSVSAILLFSVNVEAEEPASIELAPAHPTIEIQCVFQRKQILPFTRACCMIMVRAHLAAFRKWFCAPMETPLDVSPRGRS